jgi:hypothetical protein
MSGCRHEPPAGARGTKVPAPDFSREPALPTPSAGVEVLVDRDVTALR